MRGPVVGMGRPVVGLGRSVVGMGGLGRQEGEGREFVGA
jgi:hypothetical protein